MGPHILNKYQRQRAPRYTSYPASPHFKKGFGAADYQRWLEGLPPDASLSLYMHLPFCRSMCWYCGCHTTVVRGDDPLWTYLSALSQEITHVARHVPQGARVQHLHLGGGTPTLMPIEGLRSLITILRQHFCCAPEMEFAIEIDPRTLTQAMAQALGEVGVTRASLGVQSFDPTVQEAINRRQPFSMTQQATTWLRDAGIAAINLDLIYGLPRQTVQSCAETADLAVRLSPARLSVFGYAHMPAFKANQSRIDEKELPDAPARLQQRRIIEERLLAAGYIAIGLDHFAHPDDPLAKAALTGALRRNFQGYTTDSAQALLGFGASAIGRLPQGYAANAVSIAAYLKAMHDTGWAIERGHAFQGDDRARAAIIEALMCRFCVDLSEIASHYGHDAEDLAPDPERFADMLADGLAERNGDVITIPKHARPLARSVASLFDVYLDHQGTRHSQAL
jgi:oxygen-independent coproporphyrinogen III oxidase